MVFQSFLMQVTNYGNIHTIVLMLVFYFLTMLFFTSLKLRCKFLFFSCKTSFISFAELNISPAISPQQDQFSISCFRRNTYFYSPQSFCFFVQFYFISCMCYLFGDYSWSSTFWTKYFQIWFFFVWKYLLWSCIFDKYCLIS